MQEIKIVGGQKISTLQKQTSNKFHIFVSAQNLFLTAPQRTTQTQVKQNSSPSFSATCMHFNAFCSRFGFAIRARDDSEKTSTSNIATLTYLVQYPAQTDGAGVNRAGKLFMLPCLIAVKFCFY